MTRNVDLENVGGIKIAYLARLWTGSLFNSIVTEAKNYWVSVPPIKEFASRAEEHIKGKWSYLATIFEELRNLTNIGPIDGHECKRRGGNIT